MSLLPRKQPHRAFPLAVTCALPFGAKRFLQLNRDKIPCKDIYALISPLLVHSQPSLWRKERLNTILQVALLLPVR